MQDHVIYHVWIHFIPTTLYPRREKTIWSELELNPGPLASQATTLTTRPWLLRQQNKYLKREKWLTFKSFGPRWCSSDFSILCLCLHWIARLQYLSLLGYLRGRRHFNAVPRLVLQFLHRALLANETRHDVMHNHRKGFFLLTQGHFPASSCPKRIDMRWYSEPLRLFWQLSANVEPHPAHPVGLSLQAEHCRT